MLQEVLGDIINIPLHQLTARQSQAELILAEHTQVRCHVFNINSCQTCNSLLKGASPLPVIMLLLESSIRSGMLRRLTLGVGVFIQSPQSSESVLEHRIRTNHRILHERTLYERLNVLQLSRLLLMPRPAFVVQLRSERTVFLRGSLRESVLLETLRYLLHVLKCGAHLSVSERLWFQPRNIRVELVST